MNEVNVTGFICPECECHEFIYHGSYRRYLIIEIDGEIKNLTKGQSVSIPLTSSVTNTSSTQDKLVGNSYTIKNRIQMEIKKYSLVS